LLDRVIELLHRKYGFIDFNVGRNGEFDDLATQAVRRFRREWEEWCELTLVEPYPVANLDIIEKSYDSVIIPTDRKCHYKAAIDITQEANFIWSIANKLRGSYMPDKYGDVVIPMTILRRFECALEATKQAVLKAYQSNPNYPSKALCKIAGFSFYNTSEYDLKELCNDSKHIAANFKNYIHAGTIVISFISKTILQCTE